MAHPAFRLKIFTFLTILTTGWSSWAVAQTEEYMMKAAFLEHFTRFIDWPQYSNMGDPSKPFIIGIMGKNRLSQTCENFYSNNKIKSKSVEIRHVTTLSEIIRCHLLFIVELPESELEQLLAQIRNLPILTVSDSKGFCEQGVMINFYLENYMVRFEINQTAALASGLSISYHLLRLARIVGPKTGRP
jgi:hypothetical protein